MNQNSESVAKSFALVIAIIVIIVAGAGSVILIHPSTLSSTNRNLSSSSTSTAGTSTSSSSFSGTLLPYDGATKTVTFELVTQTGLSTLVNYNATNKGAMIIYVPAGSNLNITLNNMETLPHNLVLVRNTTDFPNNANVGADGTVLFGIATSTTNYRFTGNKTGAYSGTYDNITPGAYWLACGINKHAGDGLWADLIASSSVVSPYVIVTNPALQPAGFS